LQVQSKHWEKVVVLDSLSYAGNMENLSSILDEPNFKFVHGDICDVQLIESQLPQIDVIVNFAAESHVDRSILSSAEFVRTNVVGTHTLLESALRCKVSLFIQVSTDEVYGSIQSGSWSESSPLEPNSPYAATKASADLIALSFFKTHGLDVRITRCSNNYGPNQFPEKLIPLAMTNLIEGKKIPLYGDGLNSRDWLFVEDHCRAIELVIERGAAGNVYNIGGGVELTNLALLRVILGIQGSDESQIVGVEDRKGHDRRYSVNYTKLNRETGYEPQTDFEVGIRRTLEWYSHHHDWWRKLKSR
jgi:dTDP-glucose 4,6-dehydratase